ncbi:MAG: hypothetical protein K6E47_03800 [Lachnospiraceae bacterium]|nr:hypothetical protein [Lachnospiraceae bacterium]
MDKNVMKEKAIEILLCDKGKVEEKEVSEINAMYYRNTDRGGGALIVSEQGDMLFVDPFFVDYEEHVKKFKNGERSTFE